MRDYLYNLATDKSPRQKFWYGAIIERPIKILLFILSFIYGAGVRILIFFCRLKPCRLNCKVISIGNITLGGTGKTSLVEFIASFLKDQGHKVAILSRGYKRKAVRCTLHATRYTVMGDEPYMLKMNLKDIPVIVNPDRIRAAKQAICDYGADTVILDDGFQQWKLKKDLEIVTVDSLNPFGNLHLIPRGVLREPISSLKRADVFVLTKTNLNPDIQDIKDFLSSINPRALIIESIHKPLGFYKIDERDKLLKPDALKGKTVTLISGIGDPDSFESLIISLGINVGLSFRFPDHHPYTQADLENVTYESQKKSIDTIVTTQKDAIRLSALHAPRFRLHVFVLRIELKITNDEQRFLNRLFKLRTL